MIEFKAVHNHDGTQITRFTVSGHSGYAESGSDIVCAAVSAVVWMTINGIERQKLADITYSQDDAFVECDIPKKRHISADAVLSSLMYIMSELEKEYSQYIKVILE